MESFWLVNEDANEYIVAQVWLERESLSLTGFLFVRVSSEGKNTEEQAILCGRLAG